MKNSPWIGLLLLYVLWNFVTLVVMGIDKRKAERNHWRISERTLFILALALGGLGIWVGMYALHHKTKHLRFTLGIPLLLILNLLVMFGIYRLGQAY